MRTARLTTVVAMACLVLVMSGCSWFADHRIPIKPRIDPNAPAYRKTIKMIIEQRHKPEFMKWLAAEKAYQEYLLSQ